MSALDIAHTVKWGDSAWIILYLIAVYYLLYRWGSIPGWGRVVAVAMSVCLVIMYNPIIAELIAGHVFGGLEYARIGWMLVIVPVIACGLTYVTQKKKHGLIIALTVVYLASCHSYSVFKIPENVYKVPDESIELDSKLIEYDGGKIERSHIGGFISMEPDEGDCVETAIILGMMHYDPRYDARGITTEQLIAGERFNFLLADRETSQTEYEKWGYEYMDCTDHFNIYVSVY